MLCFSIKFTISRNGVSGCAVITSRVITSLTRLACDLTNSFACASLASRRLARATVGHEVEADLGTFRERRKASPLDRRDMDEHILAAVIRLNKTIAFRGVEPLHRTHCHGF